MTTLTAVIIGVGQWERYTKPLLESIEKHMPDMNTVLVDNGAHYTQEAFQANVSVFQTEQVFGYAEALNFGLKHAPVSDWYLILNNDILIEKPFSVEGFDRKALYGFITYPFRHYRYLAGWAMFIPFEALHEVGVFDPELRPMWFEDADYCIRAQKAGYRLAELDRKEVGIRHFEDENMSERKAYMNRNMQARQRNRQYVERKHGL